MAEMCANCPFATKGEGRQLRRTLAPGRWREIVTSLLRGDVFYCHKTTKHDDDGEFTPGLGEKVCAGALEFQAKADVSSNYQRVCERLEATAKARSRLVEERE
jgi:hypothetical protein